MGESLGKLGRLLRKSADRAIVQTRRELRKLSAKMAGTEIDLVFHAAYAPPDSHIVDAERSAKILSHLLTEGLTVGSRVLVPPALSVAELRRVHKDEYLESLDAPSAVARALGGDEPPPPDVAEGYLEAQRWATSGTVYATVRALQKRRLVVNLGGGFHHAERARGSGFCLFNDIAVAIEKVRQNGFLGRILVIDLDLHQGDGTRRILQTTRRSLPQVYTRRHGTKNRSKTRLTWRSVRESATQRT
ncbi:MAG: hypothetical protein IPK82_04920 [Polyangiaceae bacterium]|nr:hypothetical protein [Polyangiaceae bacterium]